MAVDRIVFVKGKVDKKRETPNLMVSEIIPVTDAVAKLTTAVCLRLDAARHDAAVLADVPGMLAKHKGTTPVYFQVATAAGQGDAVGRQAARRAAVDGAGGGHRACSSATAASTWPGPAASGGSGWSSSGSLPEESADALELVAVEALPDELTDE